MASFSSARMLQVAYTRRPPGRTSFAAAARLVRPGGRLVYATCSIVAEENEDIVNGFLAAHADFHRLSAQEVLAAQGIAIDCGADMHLSPQKHGTDAFYAVVLERAK